MKFALLLLPTLLASAATACVTAHVYQQDCFINGGDSLSAQVFDSAGGEVCQGRAFIAGASNESEFCIEGCRSGYSFCVTGNAQTATYKAPNYEVTMYAQGSQSNVFICAQTDDATFRGTEYESCFTDNYFNCNDFAECSLCDFKAVC